MNTFYIYYYIYIIICYFFFQLIYFKDIWVFLIGKIISSIVYILLDIVLINKENLQLTQKMLSWFLIEHIFEYYQKNTGKFFLTNRDFRQKLILNIFILLKNILFWSYFTTLFEFTCLILILILLSSIGILYIFYDNKKIKLNCLIFSTFFCYYISILFFKFYEFTYLDISYILKPVFFFVQLFTNIYCIFIYFCLILSFLIVLLANLEINFLNVIYILFKLIICCIIIILCVILVINLLVFYHTTNNNFLQEYYISILYLMYLLFYFIN